MRINLALFGIMPLYVLPCLSVPLFDFKLIVIYLLCFKGKKLGLVYCSNMKAVLSIGLMTERPEERYLFAPLKFISCTSRFIHIRKFELKQTYFYAASAISLVHSFLDVWMFWPLCLEPGAGFQEFHVMD